MPQFKTVSIFAIAVAALVVGSLTADAAPNPKNLGASPRGGAAGFGRQCANGSGAVIETSVVRLGVDCLAQLNTDFPGDPIGIGFMGLRFKPTGNPSTEPGCLCEGWGAADAGSGISGYANNDNDNAGLVQTGFASTPTTAVVDTDIIGPSGPAMSVRHDYHPSAVPNLFEATVTITNLTTGPLGDIRYRRVMDWDIGPTEFNEFVTLFHGTAAALIGTDTNGFDTADPLSTDGSFLPGPVTDSGPDDHGARFDFALGPLDPGQSHVFNIYYGAAATESEALSAISIVGAETYSLGQPSTPNGPSEGTPNTFIFAFSGVGGDPVPSDCGNDQVDKGETCDPPFSGPHGPQNATCRLGCTFCGDGNVDPGEDCDDGNNIDNDLCPNGCIIPTATSTTVPKGPTIACCVDGTCLGLSELDCESAGGFVAGPDCDGGFTPVRGASGPPVICPGGTTTTLAPTPVCGNGTVEPGEQCDDGNVDDGDCCNARCQYESARQPCEDGLFCNGAETCDGAGTCDPGNPPFCDDGVDCTDDSCDETGDTCTSLPVDARCDDSVSCTTDRCEPAPRSGTDGCTYTPDDSVCTDGDACTGVETCDVANDCQPGTPVNCDDLTDCTTDTCDPSTGSCSNAPDHGFCDDKISCTVDRCEPSSGRVPVNDGCTNTPDDGVCDDGAFCNGTETCDTLNDCQAGTAVDCGDKVSCTDDSCNEGTDSCDNTANDANCDDGAFCNGAETCDAANDCQVGTPVNCSGLDDDCNSGACNETTDACEAQNTNEGGGCDDGLFCTDNDTCSSGTCSGTALDCGDSVGCTVDSCDEANDTCVNTADDSSCDDGAFCNGVERCDATNDCQAGTAIDCSSFADDCNAGSCNETTDACESTPTNEDGACDDGQACTKAAECKSGTCTPTEQTVFAPSCRWLALGAETGEDVKMRTDAGAQLTGSLCSDIGDRLKGEVSAHMVATLDSGDAMRFDGGAAVGASIVSGGGGLISGKDKDAFIPNTDGAKNVPGGTSQPSSAGGGNVIDTTGSHPLLAQCQADQGLLDNAESILDGLSPDATIGQIKGKGPHTIDTGGDDFHVLHVTGNVKPAGRDTLNIIGDPEDVVIVIVDGNLQFPFGTTIGGPTDAADGFLEIPVDRPGPNNVLFYVKGTVCKIGRSAQGYGSLFCPDASKFRVGKSTRWLGSFAGGQRRGEIRLRPSVDLRRAEFSGDVPAP